MAAIGDRLPKTFNRENAKRLFYWRLNCLQGKKFDNSMRDKIITDLKEDAKKYAAAERRLVSQVRLSFTYDILEENGVMQLIKKKENPTDPICRYVTIEDLFDLLADIHEQVGHGQRLKMLQIVKKNYVVTDYQLDMFLLCCNVCNEGVNSKKVSIGTTRMFNKKIEIDILYMTIPDGLFQYVLIYRDVDTCFTLLRPLMRLCSVEISMEILKIFLDFGSPIHIHIIGEKYNNLLVQSIVHLKTLCENCNVTSNSVTRNKSRFAKRAQVLNYINHWMRESSSNNWALGCHAVQWKLNNIKNVSNSKDPENVSHSEIKETPYFSVFGFSPQRFKNTENSLPSSSENNDIVSDNDTATASECDDKDSLECEFEETVENEKNLDESSHEDAYHGNEDHVFPETIDTEMTSAVDIIEEKFEIEDIDLTMNTEGKDLNPTVEDTNLLPEKEEMSNETVKEILSPKIEITSSPEHDRIQLSPKIEITSSPENETIQVSPKIGIKSSPVHDRIQLSPKNEIASSPEYDRIQLSPKIENTVSIKNEETVQTLVLEETGTASVPAELNTGSTSGPTRDIERPLCHVCHCKIFKVYHCSQCKKTVHIFCSTRDETQYTSPPSFICTICNNMKYN